MDDIELIGWTTKVEFTDEVWRLFGKYVVMMNYDMLEAGRREQLKYNKAFGLAVTAFLLHHRERILRRFRDIHAEAREHEIAGLFTATQLTAIGTAAGADVPRLLRAYARRSARRGGATHHGGGVVYRSPGGSNGPLSRRGAKARPVRGRSLQIEPGLSPKKKKPA